MKKLFYTILVFTGCAFADECGICAKYEQQIDNAISGVNSVVDSAVALTKAADRTARSAYRQIANARYTDVIISQLRNAEGVCPRFKAKADSLAAVYSK